MAARLPALLGFVAALSMALLVGAVVYACVPVKNVPISEQAEREFRGSASGPAVFGPLATD